MTKRKTVVVAGATGFIGKAIVRLLHERGWGVIALSTSPAKAREALGQHVACIGYDGEEIERAVRDCGKVIRLSGTNPLDRRWNEQHKASMWQSRVETARRLSLALARAKDPDRVIVSAGGINIHAAEATGIVTEESPLAQGWIAGMIATKEAALQLAAVSGARAITLRIGLSLGKEGGPLAFIDSSFRKGMGGHLGDGRQFVPWIHNDDLASMFVEALENPAWNGPFIAATPRPVTAREFSAAIGRHLGRASWLHWPGPVARLVLGEMAALVLSSYNARPARALSLGFQFRFSEIDSALSSIYGTTEEADVRNMKQNKRA